MSLCDLQEKWLDLYGDEAPPFKKSFLLKRLAFRIQELFYGGLSEDSKKQLAELAANDPMANFNNPDKAKSKTILSHGRDKLLPGTRIIREWNGNKYEVIAKEKGFEYDGREFRSLSAIATEITGTKWNGKVFFKLKKRGT
jgi:hypothetical protein